MIPPAASATAAAPIDAEAQQKLQAEAMTHVVEGDDSVNIPAAPMEFLGHARTIPQHASVHMMKPESLEGRRTAIPILLVTGLMFGVGGTLKFFVGEESPVADFPMWMPIVMFVLAGILLVLGVLNMIRVGSELAKLNTRPKAPE
jgi:hypothetical protein